MRDTAGNESPSTYSDSIQVVAANSLGSIGGLVNLEGVSSHEGVFISIQGEFLPPSITESLGDFGLENLQPGTYAVSLYLPGYQEVVIPDVVVVASQRTDLGTIALPLVEPVPSLAQGFVLLLTLALVLAGWSIFASRGSEYSSP